MPASTLRRRATTGRRLAVTVTSPDGIAPSTRGLASWLSRAAPAAARGEVTVALISDGRMRALNRAFRGKDYAADVLSFPAELPAGERKASTVTRKKITGASPTTDIPPVISDAYLGDIVIASGVANRQADEAGHSVATELRVLALHGLLHLLGYDHDRDDGEMARAEARLRKKAGLKEGLIARMTPRRSHRVVAAKRSR